ncbi:MAG: hypothetical protein P8Y53_16420 [Pseudolabrys sp.]
MSDDTASRRDRIEEEIFSDEVSDESLEIAAAAIPLTTEWCAVTARCTAPVMTAFLTKGGRRS